MSISVKTIISCDAENCREHISRDTSPKAMPRGMRKQAKESGWSMAEGKDFCEHHKPTYKRVLIVG